MYDPLVVDTFLALHGDGGFKTSDMAQESSFAVINASSAMPEFTSPSRASGLEDIAASGEEMLALFELAKSLNKPMSVSDVGGVMIRHLRRIVPAGLSVLYVYDLAVDELVSAHASGEHVDLVAGLRIPLGQRLTGWVGANRQTIRNSDPILDLGEALRSVTPRPRSCLSTPLIAGDSLIGVLSLYSAGRDAFSEDHQRVVEVIARQVAPVVQQALTFDRGGSSATEVLRGSRYNQHLEILARAEPSMWKAPLALICIELGGLQELRAQFGTDTADEAVNQVVTCTRKHIRPADVVFRYENDEILIVQFKTDSVVATAMANQIRRALQAQLSEGRMKGRVQIAVGVSAMPDDGQSAEGLRIAARRRATRHTETEMDGFDQPPESIH